MLLILEISGVFVSFITIFEDGIHEHCVCGKSVFMGSQCLWEVVLESESLETVSISRRVQ
jgi:hypothetical protein